MQPGLREREREPDRAYPSPSTRSPHARGRRRADTTYVTGRGESHREVVPARQGPGTGRHHLPCSQARPQEVRRAYDQHMQRHATPAALPVPMEASGRSEDTEARTVSQLAAKLPAHQSSSGHGQDRRPDNTYQTAEGNRRPRRYPRLPIRFPPRRTHNRGLQPTGMQASAISPLLFNIYTSDIPTIAHVNLAMYADDVCIYSRSLNARMIDRRLQTVLDTLRDWYTKCRIAVHPQKNTAVLFAIGGRRRRRYGNAPELTLDSRVNWAAHIHRVLDRGRQMLGTLYPMMAGRGRLDPSLKVRIYKTVLKPAITYASAVWAIASPTYRNSRRSRTGHCAGPSRHSGS
ncbi:hypothetical protein Trydic_g16373 [Trypoxylus dichotomus]